MTAPLYDLEHDRRVVAWRVVSFERMAFGVDDATALGRRRDVDTDRVRRMLRRGASHEQVMVIVL